MVLLRLAVDDPRAAREADTLRVTVTVTDPVTLRVSDALWVATGGRVDERDADRESDNVTDGDRD